MPDGQTNTRRGYDAASGSLHGERVLVTGGAGFIGSHAVDALAKAGALPTTVDITHAPAGMPGNHIQGDVRTLNPGSLPHSTYDTVLHFASAVGVSATAANPSWVRSTIIDGTANILRVAQAVRARAFVYVSSSEVYGECDGVVNQSTRLSPRSWYGLAKANAERMVMTCGCFDTAIVRPFNVYGPKQRKDFVVPSLIVRALQCKSLYIVGDGLQTRTFTFVGDFVNAIMALLILGSFENVRVVNIAGAETIAIRSLAQLITRITGSSSAIECIEPTALGRRPEFEIRHREVDLRDTSQRLTWKPQTSMEAGLQTTIRWYANNLQHSSPRHS